MQPRTSESLGRRGRSRLTSYNRLLDSFPSRSMTTIRSSSISLRTDCARRSPASMRKYASRRRASRLTWTLAVFSSPSFASFPIARETCARRAPIASAIRSWVASCAAGSSSRRSPRSRRYRRQR